MLSNKYFYIYTIILYMAETKNLTIKLSKEQFIANCAMRLYSQGVEISKYSETQYAQICYNRAKILAEIIDYDSIKESYITNFDINKFNSLLENITSNNINTRNELEDEISELRGLINSVAGGIP